MFCLCLFVVVCSQADYHRRTSQPSFLKPYIEMSENQLDEQLSFSIASIPVTNENFLILKFLIILHEVLEETDNDDTIRSVLTAMLPFMEQVCTEPEHPVRRFYCHGCRMVFETDRKSWPASVRTFNNKYFGALKHAARENQLLSVSINLRLMAEA